MSRRRGSATALKASEVVAARGMSGNIYLYGNMSSHFFLLTLQPAKLLPITFFPSATMSILLSLLQGKAPEVAAAGFLRILQPRSKGGTHALPLFVLLRTGQSLLAAAPRKSAPG